MYALRPAGIYAVDKVFNDPACLKRMKTMLNAIGKELGDVERITIENIPQIIEKLRRPQVHGPAGGAC